MRYLRAIVPALIVLSGMAGLCLLEAATPPQPTIQCANGMPWKLCTSCAPVIWICTPKPACTRRCSMDDHRPNSVPTGGMCFMSDGIRWWGDHSLSTFAVEVPGNPEVHDFTGARLDNQTVNGGPCYYIMPHNIKADLKRLTAPPTPPIQIVPTGVNTLSTELLPLR